MSEPVMHDAHSESNRPTSSDERVREEWNQFSGELARGSLKAAKGLSWVVTIAAVTSAILATISLVALSTYLLIALVTGGTVAIPAALAASLPFAALNGWMLFFALLAALVVSAMFVALTFLMIRGLYNHVRRRNGQERR